MPSISPAEWSTRATLRSAQWRWKTDPAGSATQTPRYSVLCDGVEWVVAEGEHNAWEAIVLFLLQRAKRDGVLGGL